MELILDHFFILVSPGAACGDALVKLGLEEGVGNTHPGQGTANRRFYFANTMLELLWIRDEREARSGPGTGLHLLARSSSVAASPFGLVVRKKEHSDEIAPFEGWSYQPDYFPAPKAFHIAANSAQIDQPLCIFLPFLEPFEPLAQTGKFKTVARVRIHTTAKMESKIFTQLNSVESLSVVHGKEHLMEIEFSECALGSSKDFRPDLPLIIYW